MCTIYGPICKYANLFCGKKILNVTSVKLFPRIKIQCFLGVFDAFLFQPLSKGKYLSISQFVTCYCLKISPKICNKSKFTKELEIIENLTVDEAQYAFHKNWLFQQNFSNHMCISTCQSLVKKPVCHDGPCIDLL